MTRLRSTSLLVALCGGVAVLVAGRIEAQSKLMAEAAVQLLPPRQYAVSVQTWHW